MRGFPQRLGKTFLALLQFLDRARCGLKLRQGIRNLALRFLDRSEGLLESGLLISRRFPKLLLQLGNLLVQFLAGGLQF